ncbi:CheR family methyltransferase [Pseudooceanicola nanhaiensis]|uniref:CheR family methyltransferase n=1 Tax=Pseudooceanicola nanhaiensis TaxID=375761 RepID=UPI001CD3E78A|nr:protein-glutamate O-methyltransferase CheR [Pseudooceanicola nanhaiensis]MCA0921665.1 protein-glutamate O-methyltransferase CheR [Pseudooceanicola nanhaiensis]
MTTASSNAHVGATMSDRAFSAIAAIAKAEAGLVLPAGKMTMVQSRLRKRLIAIGFTNFDDYVELVSSRDGDGERKSMISALTTNVSHFFREGHHFTILREQVLPPLLLRARRGERIRIWSAGCSSGQEPYSIAMCLLTAAPDIARYDLRILATDIDEAILAKAQEAIYSRQQSTGIPEDLQRAYLQPGPSSDTVRIAKPVRDLVTLRQLNLLGPWPMRHPFDAIFCRNVVIYFDAQTQAALWPRFHAALSPQGWLFLGHSERVSETAHGLFSSMGMTAYRSGPSIATTATG